jgi:hypothetical protein
MGFLLFFSEFFVLSVFMINLEHFFTIQKHCHIRIDFLAAHVFKH